MSQSVKHQPENYLELANQVGWGPQNQTIDPTKKQLLDTYLTGNKILDLGCASGKYTHYLTTTFPNLKVAGVDQNKSLIETANKSQTKATFTVASATNLPFQDNAFDTTIMFDLLEHLDENQALKEVRRITRKRLILTVPRTTDPELSNLFLLFGHHLDPTHQRTYTKASIKKLLTKHQLKPVFIQPSHPISTDALFLNILRGPLLIKKLLRKLAFNLTPPKTFHSNLAIVADVPTNP